MYFLKIISEATVMWSSNGFPLCYSSSAAVELHFPRIIFRLQTYIWCCFIDVYVIFIKISLSPSLHVLPEICLKVYNDTRAYLRSVIDFLNIFVFRFWNITDCLKISETYLKDVLHLWEKAIWICKASHLLHT